MFDTPYPAGRPLQEWINEYVDTDREEKFVYGRAGINQAVWVRDTLRTLFAPRDYEDSKRFPTKVAAEHTSKSVPLPVYSLAFRGGEIIMRGNFHDWVISVVSDRRIEWDFGNLAKKDEGRPNWGAEGFKDDWIFPSYVDSLNVGWGRQMFTVTLPYDNGAVWAFLYLIARQVDPERWGMVSGDDIS